MLQLLPRSNRPEVRNPLLKLPAAQKISRLPAPMRAALRELLLELQRDARSNANKCWATHKAPQACYWKVVAVYTGHIARLLRDRENQALKEAA